MKCKSAKPGRASQPFASAADRDLQSPWNAPSHRATSSSRPASPPSPKLQEEEIPDEGRRAYAAMIRKFSRNPPTQESCPTGRLSPSTHSTKASPEARDSSGSSLHSSHPKLLRNRPDSKGRRSSYFFLFVLKREQLRSRNAALRRRCSPFGRGRTTFDIDGLFFPLSLFMRGSILIHSLCITPPYSD